MKGLKKDKIPKKTAKKIMVALACMMATSLPFNMPIAGATEYFVQNDNDDSITSSDQSNPVTSSGTDVDGNKGKVDTDLSGGGKDDRLYGGKADGDASATNNEITVEANGEFDGRIVGGQSGDTAGEMKQAANNTVTVKDGTIGTDDAAVTATIIGGEAKGDSTSKDNTVAIHGGAVTGAVVGGRANNGLSTGNKVVVDGGTITKVTDAGNPNAVFGGSSANGDAVDNAAEISGGTISGDIMGGYAAAAGKVAEDNKVEISDGTITGQVDGGRAQNGRADGNTVTVTGGTITGVGSTTLNAILGGNGAAGANKNEVTISNGTISGSVFGGFSTTGDAGAEDAGNKVTITGGTFTMADGNEVSGGHAVAGNADYNEVTINLAADTTLKSVMGGVAEAAGKTASNNKVTISGSGTLTAEVDGGTSHGGDAMGNKVAISGAVAGDVTGGNAAGSGNAGGNMVDLGAGANITAGDVRGGASENGNANQNIVNVGTGAAAAQNVTGGYSWSAGNANSNQVTVEGEALSAAGGYVAGSGTANGNTLTVKGSARLTDTGSMKGAAAGVALYGTADGNNLFIQDDANIAGYAAAGVASVLGGSGQATNNTLTMTGGTVDGNVQGGYSIGGDATGNGVVMSGGTAGNNVYGGYAINNALNSGNAADNNTVEISGGTVANHVMGGNGWSGANDNTVTLKGGTFGHGVYGGRIEGADTSLLRNNRVFISGASEFTDTNATITAALAKSASETDRYVNTSGTGNNVYLGYVDENTTAPLTKAINVDTIAGENLYLGAFGGEAVTAGESGAAVTAVNVKAGNIDLSKVAVDRIVSEDFTILEATDGLDPSTTVTDGTVTMGTTVQQEAGKVGANKIGFKPGTRTVQTQTSHALLNAQAGVAALAAGNTLIERAVAGLDMDSQAVENPREWRSFAYVGGGKAKYDTGSSVTTNTWNGMLGFGRHDQRKGGGALTYGIFYEYGNGNYSTDDSDGRGDGDARYNGGGLLAKNETANGFYYEGSFRAGRMKNDANNILRVGNRTYGYSEDSNYWGFHLGVGKVLKFNNDRSLDVYGKYFYNHLDGINFDAAGHYDLDDVKTSLLRLGARYNFLKRSGWTSYGGFAYEYEFGGEAGGFADGFAIRKADLGGSSVLFELGMKLLPDDKSPWGLDLNLTAHAGQRKGVMGGATVSYAF